MTEMYSNVFTDREHLMKLFVNLQNVPVKLAFHIALLSYLTTDFFRGIFSCQLRAHFEDLVHSSGGVVQVNVSDWQLNRESHRLQADTH